MTKLWNLLPGHTECINKFLHIWRIKFFKWGKIKWLLPLLEESKEWRHNQQKYNSMLLSRHHYKLSFLLFSELKDQLVDPPNNLYFGAKHIPLFTQRPFHLRVCHCSFEPFFLCWFKHDMVFQKHFRFDCQSCFFNPFLPVFASKTEGYKIAGNSH